MNASKTDKSLKIEKKMKPENKMPKHGRMTFDEKRGENQSEA